MSDYLLKNDSMVEAALRGVLKTALEQAAEQGLPGDHHFYITFLTTHPDVVIPDVLRARFPSEMTIVLQYQFWGLEVGADAFAVTLSFSDVPERLTVPFEAVTAFADPSVRFRLQFDAGKRGKGEDPVSHDEAAEPETNAANTAHEDAPTETAREPAEPEPAPAAPGAKVVALDAFRKK